jgi:hypothetical protein
MQVGKRRGVNALQAEHLSSPAEGLSGDPFIGGGR